MEVGAKPICLSAVAKPHVVCHITPPDDEPAAAKPKPKNVYSLSPSSRSPSPSRRSSPRTSFLHDAYRALTGAKSSSLMPPQPADNKAGHNASCLLDVPKDGQFRNRSKSLDDGTRKAMLANGSARLDSGDAYKIFESILKEGTECCICCPRYGGRAAPPPVYTYARVVRGVMKSKIARANEDSYRTNPPHHAASLCS